MKELGYGNVTLAGEAAVPSGPSSPRPSRDALLGGALGLLIGLAIVFVLERRDTRVRSVEELAELYAAPVLASVPQMRALAGSPDAGGSSVRETFALIRAQLRAGERKRAPQKLVVLSADAGEGKSTIALRLASTAARMGSEVLLIEADLRKPSLAARLAVNERPGVAEVLSGRSTTEEATQVIEAEQADGELARPLRVIPAGDGVQNPGALFDGGRLERLLQRAVDEYELVVIDGPALVVGEACTLLEDADGALVVCALGRARRDSVQRARHLLELSGTPVLGVVANRHGRLSATSHAGPARARRTRRSSRHLHQLPTVSCRARTRSATWPPQRGRASNPRLPVTHPASNPPRTRSLSGSPLLTRHRRLPAADAPSSGRSPLTQAAEPTDTSSGCLPADEARSSTQRDAHAGQRDHRLHRRSARVSPFPARAPGRG